MNFIFKTKNLIIFSLFFILAISYSLGAVAEASTISSPVINLGLVGHWTFDGKKTVWTSDTAGTATDSSSLGNTGTLTDMNRSTAQARGMIGQALSFDGNNDYVVLPSGVAQIGTGDFSISTWSYYQAGAGNLYLPTISSRASGGFGDQKGYSLIWTNSGSVFFLVDTGAGGYTSPTANSVSSGWHHVTATFDNGVSASIYVDGVLAEQDTTSIPSGNLTSIYQTRIGRAASGSGLQSFQGPIDDVRVYDRALTQTEITKLYNAGKARIGLSQSTNSLVTSLVGHWTFDGSKTPWTSSTAGTATDSSGNSNTGTLTNMSQATTPTRGVIGQALNFDGTDDTVLISNTTNTLDGSTAMTVSAWVKRGVAGNTLSVVAQYRSGFGKWQLFISGGGDPNKAEFIVVNASSQLAQAVADTSLGTDIVNWHHIVGVYDGSTVQVYVDGVAGDSTPPALTGGIIDRNYNICIGGETTGGGNCEAASMNGGVDDVRIYSRALSAAEIKRLYNMGRPTVMKPSYILDRVTSAAAAYSVRKLRAGYTGNAMLVRRDSDSTTQAIGFNGDGNLRTDTLLSFCAGVNCYIDTWYDQSGNARNLIQSTAANQPQIVSSGALITGLNSKPAMTFDGSTDYLRAVWTQAQPETVMLVFNPISWTSADGVFDGTTFNTMRLLQYPSSSSYQIYAGALVPAVSFANGSWSLVTATFAGASSELRKNSDIASTGNVGSSSGGGFVLGSSGDLTSQCSNISASEVIIWPSDLSSGQESGARSNINNYFQVY